MLLPSLAEMCAQDCATSAAIFSHAGALHRASDRRGMGPTDGGMRGCLHRCIIRAHLRTSPHKRDWKTERSSVHSAANSTATVRIWRSLAAVTEESRPNAPLASGCAPRSLQEHDAIAFDCMHSVLSRHNQLDVLSNKRICNSWCTKHATLQHLASAAASRTATAADGWQAGSKATSGRLAPNGLVPSAAPCRCKRPVCADTWTTQSFPPLIKVHAPLRH